MPIVQLLACILIFATSLEARGQYLAPKNFCSEVEALFCQQKGCKLSQQTQRKHQCMEYLNPLIEQKSVRYGGQKASECLKELKSGQKSPAACREVALGLVGLGQPCEWSVSCIKPWVCVKNPGNFKGSCGKPLAKGAPCERETPGESFFSGLLTQFQGVCGGGAACIADTAGVSRCQ